MDNIMVSILMPVYNHEDYIEKALDSVLMQKVGFRYEIIIGDDASSDRTSEILKKYKNSYSDKIKLFVRRNNLGCSKNAYRLFQQCQGKYVAMLEGDDYWVDVDKLQKQVDYMETHPEYSATAHRCLFVDHDNKLRKDREINQGFFNGNIYSMSDYEKAMLPGQTATLLLKNINQYDDLDLRLIYRMNGKVFDLTLVLILLSKGNIYCFDEVWSHYRQVTNQGSSWSALQQQSNVRDDFFVMQERLERCAFKYFSLNIDLGRRKKDIYVSALFKFLRDHRKLDLIVVFNIILKSNNPIYYILFGSRVLLKKYYYKTILKQDQKVEY